MSIRPHRPEMTIIRVLYNFSAHLKSGHLPFLSSPSAVKGKAYVTLLYEDCCVYQQHQLAELCPALLCPHGLRPARLLCSRDFTGKNTGVGCHFLFQGIFPTQRLNPRLLPWQVDSLPLSYLGSPKLVYNRSK